MNPDSGQLHNVSADFKKLYGRVNPREEESIEELLERARKRHAELQPDSEPPPGSDLPDDWPRFSIGDRVGPIKGWWFTIVSVDVEAQTVSIRPAEPTRAKQRKREKRHK